MFFHQVYIEGFLDWIDTFTEVTGLSTSNAAQIYAELCGFNRIETMLEALSNRDKVMGDFAQQKIVDEFIGIIVRQGDDLVSPEVLKERHAWHHTILTYHGFDEEFINNFSVKISPTSETGLLYFEYPRKASISEWYVKLPYEFRDRKEELEKIKLKSNDKPDINTEQWMNLFNQLGFQIHTSSISSEVSCDSSSFSIGKNNKLYAEIYISDTIKYPFEADSERVQTIKSRVERFVNFVDFKMIAIVLWPNPISVSRGNQKVIFYGMLLHEGWWYDMPLHTESNSMERILNDSFLVGAESIYFENSDWFDFEDSDSTLPKVLFSNKPIKQDRRVPLVISTLKPKK